MNVNTAETSQYSNYNFMHIINIGNKHYGVKSDGLYLLEGTTDSGTAINGSITTKETNFISADDNKPKFSPYQSKRMNYVYLNTDTPTTITPFVDGVQKLTCTSSFGGRKTKMALGNSGRYWQFKIDGIIKLEGLELIPLALQRRIK